MSSLTKIPKSSGWTSRKQKLLELAESVQGSKLAKPPLDARVKNDVIELLIASEVSKSYWVGMGGYKQALKDTGLQATQVIPASDILLQIAQHHCESHGRKMPENIDDVFVNDGALYLSSKGQTVWGTIFEKAKAAFDEWEANCKAIAARAIKVNWDNIVPVVFFETSTPSGQFSKGVTR